MIFKGSVVPGVNARRATLYDIAISTSREDASWHACCPIVKGRAAVR